MNNLGRIDGAGGEGGNVDGRSVGEEVEMTDKVRNGRVRSPLGMFTLPLGYGSSTATASTCRQMEVEAKGGPRMAEHRLLNP